MLDKYGTVGLFTEDSLDSIHAIVNQLARRYASLEQHKILVHSEAHEKFNKKAKKET